MRLTTRSDNVALATVSTPSRVAPGSPQAMLSNAPASRLTDEGGIVFRVGADADSDMVERM